jgi:hypothetical protein
MKKSRNIISEVTGRVIREQARVKRLSEAVEYDPEHPERMNPSLERTLRSGEHVFGKSKSIPSTGDLSNYSEKIASKRFKEIINKVKRYHGVQNISPTIMQEMFRIMSEVSQIEARHKDALERLAIDIVSEEFDIPQEMLEVELVPPGSKLSIDSDEEEEEEDETPSSQPQSKQPKSAERLEQLEIEVDKRNIINAMMQGAAKKGHYIFHMVADELDSIDPRLMGLYGKLMSIADFQYWVIPDTVMGGQIGGTEKIVWKKAEKDFSNDPDDSNEEDGGENIEVSKGEEYPVVVAKAWIFPLLVHELIKGSMELAASSWAEGHLDFEEQKQVISLADTPSNEIWGMRLGPGMWEKFLECVDDEDYDIKQWLFRELTKLPAQKFHEFVKEILSGSQRCKEIMKELKDLHNEDQSDSLEDMFDETGYDDMGDILNHLGDESSTETDEIEDEDTYYKNMSKSELQKLIDDALDSGDFEKVSKLHKYL